MKCSRLASIAITISALVVLANHAHADVALDQVITYVRQISPYAAQIESSRYTATLMSKDDDSDSSWALSVGDRRYVVDAKTGLIKAIHSSVDAEGRPVAPLTQEEVWSLRPDLPKNNLRMSIEQPDFVEYSLIFNDGSYDRNVGFQYDMDSANRIIRASYRNNPIGLPSVAPKISKDQARGIALDFSRGYQHPNGGGSFYTYKYAMTKSIIGPMQEKDDTGRLLPVYIVYCDVSSTVNFESSLSSTDKDECAGLSVVVNAVDGVVTRCHLFTNLDGSQRTTTKTTSGSVILTVTLDTKKAIFHQPCYQLKQSAIVPVSLVKALAKDHTVTAKADAKAFKLDGNELALPAKVLSRKGVLYLPWQSLNSLPGVKAMFDAKLAKLDITTASATAAK